jgi:hypothetical protein
MCALQADIVERLPFLLMGLELPPTPLFKDALEKNIIPQVSSGRWLLRLQRSTVSEGCLNALCFMHTACRIIAGYQPALEELMVQVHPVVAGGSQA